MSAGTVSFQTVKKLQEIPIVNSVWESSTNIYNSVKSVNALTLYGFLMLERSFHLALMVVDPLIKKFEAPIQAIDSLTCVAIDKVLHTLPFIETPTEEALSSTSQVILENGIVQKSISFVDKSLFYAEKAVRVIPKIKVEDVSDVSGSNFAENKKDAMDVLIYVQQLYGFATKPLRIMGQFIHQRRESLKKLQISPNDSQDRKRKRSNKADDVGNSYKPGFIERLLFLPVSGLHKVGEYAQKRSELKMLEDPEIDVNEKMKYKKIQDEENKEVEELNFSNSDDCTDSEHEDINKAHELMIESNTRPVTNDGYSEQKIESSHKSNNFT